MTTSDEWSVNFDILYNNISSDQAPGLTEYEKSVFLTQAQEAVILDLYKGTSGDAFETTEEVTRYLSSLVISTEIRISEVATSEKFIYNILQYVTDRTVISQVMFIIYQSGTILYNDKARDVLFVPTRQDSLFKDLNNPFKGPNKNRVLVTSEGEGTVLYSKYPVDKYYIKYLKRPNPIVLENSELEISEVSDFKVEIPESLHNQVLYKAVQLAKAVWQS